MIKRKNVFLIIFMMFILISSALALPLKEHKISPLPDYILLDEELSAGNFQNGGFEEGDLSYWLEYNSNGGNVSSNVVHTGYFSFYSPSGGTESNYDYFYQQNIELTNSSMISFWIYSTHDMSIEGEVYNAETEYDRTFFFQTIPNHWKQCIIATSDMPLATSYEFYFGNYNIYGANSDDVYFDDFNVFYNGEEGDSSLISVNPSESSIEWNFSSIPFPLSLSIDSILVSDFDTSSHIYTLSGLSSNETHTLRIYDGIQYYSKSGTTLKTSEIKITDYINIYLFFFIALICLIISAWIRLSAFLALVFSLLGILQSLDNSFYMAVIFVTMTLISIASLGYDR